jgi:hypothetical protein
MRPTQRHDLPPGMPRDKPRSSDAPLPGSPVREFGERVALLRTQAGLSEAELAARSELGSIASLERGVFASRARGKSWVCVKGLKVSPNVLLSGMYGRGDSEKRP